MSVFRLFLILDQLYSVLSRLVLFSFLSSPSSFLLAFYLSRPCLFWVGGFFIWWLFHSLLKLRNWFEVSVFSLFRFFTTCFQFSNISIFALSVFSLLFFIIHHSNVPSLDLSSICVFSFFFGFPPLLSLTNAIKEFGPCSLNLILVLKIER